VIDYRIVNRPCRKCTDCVYSEESYHVVKTRRKKRKKRGAPANASENEEIVKEPDYVRCKKLFRVLNENESYVKKMEEEGRDYVIVNKWFANTCEYYTPFSEIASSDSNLISAECELDYVNRAKINEMRRRKKVREVIKRIESVVENGR